MSYDATTHHPDATPLWTPAPAPITSTSHFSSGEGIGLPVGALALGALAGGLAFFGFGRVDPGFPLIAAFVGYAYAVYLAGMSWRDVIREREPVAIALFGLHMTALLAWPLLLLNWADGSWRLLFGLPTAFVAIALFLMTARAPASAVYRSSAHVFLVAAIGGYQGLWAAMTV